MYTVFTLRYQLNNKPACVINFFVVTKVETMRTSSDCIVKMMFSNQLSKTGNLTMAYEEQQVSRTKPSGKSKWGAALVAEKTNTKVGEKNEISLRPHRTF